MTPYDADERCPKCGSAAITTEFHHGLHPRCTLGSYEGYMAYMELATQFAEVGVVGEPPAQVPEHIERQCVNCKYGWAEEPLS